MSIQRYSVNQHPVQTLLSWIESDEIAIPEIQRPFVLERSEGARLHRLALFRLSGWLPHCMAESFGAP